MSVIQSFRNVIALSDLIIIPSAMSKAATLRSAKIFINEGARMVVVLNVS